MQETEGINLNLETLRVRLILVKPLQVHSATSSNCWLVMLQDGIRTVLCDHHKGSYFVAEVLGCVAEVIGVAHSQNNTLRHDSCKERLLLLS